MFNRKFKLIATAIGLVAVLVMGLAMPGVTQQVELLTREQIVKRLSQLVAATLTAAEGDILDIENTVFASHPFYIFADRPTPPLVSSITYARIPLHPSSRSVQLLYEWLDRDEPFGDFLNLGAFYVENDFPGCSGYAPLKAGIYQLKVRKDLKLIAVDSTGDEFVIGYVKRTERSQSSSYAILDCPWCGWAVRGLVVLVCAFTDPQFCRTETKCIPYAKPDGTIEIKCWEEKECWGC